MGVFAKHETGNILVLATELLAIKTGLFFLKGLEFSLDCYLFPLMVEFVCLFVCFF